MYVKTVPPGAEVTLDGKVLGKSDGLFDVAAGAHKLSLSWRAMFAKSASIEVRDGEITRVEVELKKRSGQETVLSYVGDSSDDMRSFADSGHAVAFQRPADMKSIVAVKLFGARYGYPEPPKEDFHIYLLDQNQKVLEQIAVPYGKIERGELRWYTLEFPAIEVPEKFFVAVWFNAEATKGVYVGMDKNVQETHSYIGLPDKGFQKVDKPYEWMIRAVVSSESGKQPTHPKVTTYEEEKAADTESTEALPTRTWNDATGAFSVEAQFAGVEDGKVMLKKADGKIVAVPLEQLCKEDQDFVAEQNGETSASHQAGRRRDPRTVARQRQDGQQVEHRRRRPCREVQGRRRLVLRHLREPARLALRQCRSRRRRTSRSGFATPSSSRSRRSTSPTVPTFAAIPVWKSFRIRAHARAAGVHRLLRLQSASDQRGLRELRRPDERNVDGRRSRRRAPKPFTKGNWLIRCKVEKRAENGRKLSRRDVARCAETRRYACEAAAVRLTAPARSCRPACRPCRSVLSS